MPHYTMSNEVVTTMTPWQENSDGSLTVANAVNDIRQKLDMKTNTQDGVSDDCPTKRCRTI